MSEDVTYVLRRLHRVKRLLHGLRDAGTSVSPEAIASPPSGPMRLVVSVLIVAHLLWQAAVPASYYFGDGVSDERFSWRMFSEVWLLHKTCTASVTEWVVASGSDGTGSVRRVDLRRTLQATWIRQLSRARRPVVDKLLRARCETDPAVIGVEFTRTCPVVPESRMLVDVRLSCQTGALAGSREMP